MFFYVKENSLTSGKFSAYEFLFPSFSFFIRDLYVFPYEGREVNDCLERDFREYVGTSGCDCREVSTLLGLIGNCYR